jgi:hypothetical protein
MISGVILVIILCVGIIGAPSFSSSLFQSSDKEATTPTKKTVKLGAEDESDLYTQAIREGKLERESSIRDFNAEVSEQYPAILEIQEYEVILTKRIISQGRNRYYAVETIDRSQYHEKKDKESTKKNLSEPRNQYILANGMVIPISKSLGKKFGLDCYINEVKTFSTIVQTQYSGRFYRGYIGYQNTPGPTDRLLVSGDCSSPVPGGRKSAFHILVDIKNGEKIPFSDPSNLLKENGENIISRLPFPIDTETGIVYAGEYSTTHGSQPIAVFEMGPVLTVFSLTNGTLIDRIWFERDY